MAGEGKKAKHEAPVVMRSEPKTKEGGIACHLGSTVE